MNRRGNNNQKVLKTFKDYLVPIFVVFIIFILILNYILGGDDTTVNPVSQDVGFTMTLSSPATEAYVEYSGGNKTKIEGEVSLYKSEKLQVASESVKLVNENVELNLNRLGELRYNEDGTYTLFSSDLWGTPKQDINIEMRYAKVKALAGTTFNLSQNEVASTAYVLAGTIEIQNLAGVSTMLQKGEKLVIMRNNASDADVDFSLSKETIDDYIKNEDWFIKNNGASILAQQDISSTSTGGTLTGKSLTGETLLPSGNTPISGNTQEYILFKNIFDGSEVSSSSLDIEGSIIDDRAVTVNINGKNAEIDTVGKTFVVKGVDISKTENDIVYKIYDTNSTLLSKGVMTLYNVSGNVGGTATSGNNGLAQVQNYPISSSPLYKIVTPKENPYTTTENVVRIEGTLPARTVSKIVINGFQLKKFVAYSSYWQYFANSEFGNLMPGVNIYKIEFYGENNEIIYETNFTIIKESEALPESSTSSGEVQ